MRIIDVPLASLLFVAFDRQFPNQVPYKSLDTTEKDAACGVGDATHYSTVITIPPSIPRFSEDVDQSAIVNLSPASVNTWCEERVFQSVKQSGSTPSASRFSIRMPF